MREQKQLEPFTYNSAFGGNVCDECNHAPCQCKVDAWWKHDWHAETIQRAWDALQAVPAYVERRQEA